MIVKKVKCCYVNTKMLTIPALFFRARVYTTFWLPRTAFEEIILRLTAHRYINANGKGKYTKYTIENNHEFPLKKKKDHEDFIPQ